jgi:hypothetical protein
LDGWLAEYTTELLNVLNVLGRLVMLEPKQADLLNRVCAAPTIAADDMGAAASPMQRRKRLKPRTGKQGELLG